MIAIPLGNKDGLWQSLSFRSLPQNQVTFAKKEISVEVKKSSSPLIYPLKNPQKVQSITLKGRVKKGALAIPPGATQGDGKADDYILKVGLVKKGEKTLNWFQRKIAPDWVLKLYSLAPKNTGVSHIEFLVLGSQEKSLGRKRTHPLSNLLQEEVIGIFKPGKPFVLHKKFAKPMETLALWISVDGDDTGSSFDVGIDSIEIQTQP